MSLEQRSRVYNSLLLKNLMQVFHWVLYYTSRGAERPLAEKISRLGSLKEMMYPLKVFPQEACSEFADVAWIDFSKGCTEGYVRFKESGGARKALEGLTAAGGQLSGADSAFRVLEGK